MCVCVRVPIWFDYQKVFHLLQEHEHRTRTRRNRRCILLIFCDRAFLISNSTHKNKIFKTINVRKMLFYDCVCEREYEFVCELHLIFRDWHQKESREREKKRERDKFLGKPLQKKMKEYKILLKINRSRTTTAIITHIGRSEFRIYINYQPTNLKYLSNQILGSL